VELPAAVSFRHGHPDIFHRLAVLHVAALTRKIFIVYLQGVALFMFYVIGITVFSATRSLERFWSGILDPIGFILLDDITRYWTVVEKNTLFVRGRRVWPTASSSTTACSGLQRRAAGARRSGRFLPHVGGGAHCRSQGRAPPKRKNRKLTEDRPVRSLVGRIPRVH
jgi:ABC-2 type transport system permease protein